MTIKKSPGRSAGDLSGGEKGILIQSVLRDQVIDIRALLSAASEMGAQFGNGGNGQGIDIVGNARGQIGLSTLTTETAGASSVLRNDLGMIAVWA
jgi:hypothetical protein